MSLTVEERCQSSQMVERESAWSTDSFWISISCAVPVAWVMELSIRQAFISMVVTSAMGYIYCLFMLVVWGWAVLV